MTNIPPAPANIHNPLRKLVAVVTTVAVISLALMFSVVVIAVILVVGAIAWSYLWWKTRHLRKQMRNHPSRGVVMEGDIVEGEVIEGEANCVTETREMR